MGRQAKEENQEEIIREIIVEKKSGFNYPEMVVIMIIALLFGFFIGNVVNFTKHGDSKGKSELKELEDTYYNIVNNYYEEVDKEKLIDAGIKGMINYLDDPYATYFEGASSDEFNQSLEGSYQGIGIEVMQTPENIVVNKVFEKSPAQKAGFMIGDILLEVAGNLVEGKSLTEVVSLIKGDNKNKVDIKVLRNNQELILSVSRSKVEIQQVNYKVYPIDNVKVGYVKIDVFSSNIAKQFKNAMGVLEDEKIDRLVIDVRDNPGGYLTQVSEILSMFMTKKQVIYQLETKGSKEKVYGMNKKAKYEYPVVVLINEESASASEILAGAFKETYNSEVIGVNSYGKGTVQRTDDLNSGDTIKYTVQKWLTPKGNWVNKKGLEPTEKVELVLEEGVELTDNNDTQLQRALEIISKK